MFEHTMKRVGLVLVIVMVVGVLAAAEEGTENGPPEGALYDQALVDLGRQKATELGHNPVPVYMGEKGISICQGTRFSIRNGVFAVAENDMLINVGNAPVDAGEHKLQQGEYSVVKEESFTPPKSLLSTEETFTTASKVATAVLNYAGRCGGDLLENQSLPIVYSISVRSDMAAKDQKIAGQEMTLYGVYEYTGDEVAADKDYEKEWKKFCAQPAGDLVVLSPILVPALEVTQGETVQTAGFDPLAPPANLADASQEEQEKFMAQFNLRMQSASYAGTVPLVDGVEAAVGLRISMMIFEITSDKKETKPGDTVNQQVVALIQTEPTVLRFLPEKDAVYTLNIHGDGSLLRYKASIVDEKDQEVVSASLALQEEDRGRVVCGLYLKGGLR